MTYAKTRKGQGEIESRSGGLTPRVRRALILVDGKRDADQIGAMIGDANVGETLESLVDEGYIEPVGPEVPSEAPVPGPAPVAEAVAAEGGEGGTVDPKQLEMARNFMLNTIKTFNGPYNKLGLMTKIRDGRGPADLRSLFDEWLHAISETRMGKARAEELSGQLRAVLDKAG